MEDNYTKIEAYIKQQMSEAEKTTFKAEMQANPALEEEVKLNILARQTTELMAQKEWKDKIGQWKSEQTSTSVPADEQSATTTSTPVVPLWRRLSIAASILILIVAGLGWWANSNYSNSGLAAGQYLMADMVGSKGGATDLDVAFEQGTDAFAAQKYSAAIEQLSDIGTDNSNYLAAQYYLGHSHYLLKNYPTASAAFEQVLAQDALPAFINRDKVKWNLVLSYLAGNQDDIRFDQLLNELINTGTAPYHQKAKVLQKDLNSVWRRLVL